MPGGKTAGRIERLARLARLLDARFGLPGTRLRFGLDALLGVIPGVGDIATGCLSLYIVWEAWRLGVPLPILLRMLFNIGLEVVVGAVPIAGDLFDIGWKANLRNVALLRGALMPNHTAHGTRDLHEQP